MLSHFRDVVGELHAEELVHIGSERLFNTDRHSRREVGFAVERVGKCRAADLQNLCRLGYV